MPKKLLRKLSVLAGTAALRRAKQAGPHVSVVLALMPKQAPQLKVLAQSVTPSFCPEFLAAEERQIRLDNSHIRALATQVDHHSYKLLCSRL